MSKSPKKDPKKGLHYVAPATSTASSEATILLSTSALDPGSASTIAETTAPPQPHERRSSTAAEFVSSIRNIFSSTGSGVIVGSRPRTPDGIGSRTPDGAARAPKTPKKEKSGKISSFDESKSFHDDSGGPPGTPAKSEKGKKLKKGKKDAVVSFVLPDDNDDSGPGPSTREKMQRCHSASNLTTGPRKTVSFGTASGMLSPPSQSGPAPHPRRHTVNALPSIKITDMDPAAIPLPPTPSAPPPPAATTSSTSSQSGSGSGSMVTAPLELTQSPPQERGLEIIPEVPENIKKGLVVLEHLSEDDVRGNFFPQLLAYNFPSLAEAVDRILGRAGIRSVEKEISAMGMKHVGKVLLMDHSLGDKVADVLLIKVEKQAYACHGGSFNSGSTERIGSDGGEEGEQEEEKEWYYTCRIQSHEAQRAYFQLTKLAIAELKSLRNTATPGAATTNTTATSSGTDISLNVLTRQSSVPTQQQQMRMTMSEYLKSYGALSERLSNLPLFGTYSPVEVAEIYVSIAECMPPIPSLSLYNTAKLRSILDDVDDKCLLVLRQLNMDAHSDFLFAENLRRRIRRERKGYLENECYWKSEGFFVKTRDALKRMTGAPRGTLTYAGRDDGLGGDDEKGSVFTFDDEGDFAIDGGGDERSAYDEDAVQDALAGGLNEGNVLGADGRDQMELRPPRFDGGGDEEHDGGGDGGGGWGSKSKRTGTKVMKLVGKVQKGAEMV